MAYCMHLGWGFGFRVPGYRSGDRMECSSRHFDCAINKQHPTGSFDTQGVQECQQGCEDPADERGSIRSGSASLVFSFQVN